MIKCRRGAPPVIAPNEITDRVLRALPGAAVEVRDMTGTADHYELRVVSGSFEGLGQVERHRLVYAALSDVMGGPIHALSLKTLAPKEAL